MVPSSVAALSSTLLVCCCRYCSASTSSSCDCYHDVQTTCARISRLPVYAQQLTLNCQLHFHRPRPELSRSRPAFSLSPHPNWQPTTPWSVCSHQQHHRRNRDTVYPRQARRCPAPAAESARGLGEVPSTPSKSCCCLRARFHCSTPPLLHSSKPTTRPPQTKPSSSFVLLPSTHSIRHDLRHYRRPCRRRQ
jgi:hypothetical protein